MSDTEKLIAELRKLLESMSDEQRLEVFSAVREDYCEYCGSMYLPCFVLQPQQLQLLLGLGNVLKCRKARSVDAPRLHFPNLCHGRTCGMSTEYFTRLTKDGFQVLLDADAIPLFDQYTWWYSKRTRMRYVASGTTSNGKKKHFLLHRIVIDAGTGEICDHINGDTLDNRRCNLRIVTAIENSRNAAKKKTGNATRFKGVTARFGKFNTSIRIDGKLKWLGTYTNDAEAAYVYDTASLAHHGEFGRRNFLPLVK